MNSAKLKGLLALIVLINFVNAQQPFYYSFILPASTKQNTDSSQETDLISYDSAKCVCDITYYKDYDCSCDPDTTNPPAQSYSNTSRKTTLEQDYLLKDYPFCDTLRDSVNTVIPSQINNIACLAMQNTPYHGEFFDAIAGTLNVNFATMTNLGSKGQFQNYNVTDFLQHYKPSSTLAINPSQISSQSLKYAPDFFGYCRLVPILKPNIVNYGDKCKGQASVGTNAANNKITLILDDQSPNGGGYKVSAQTTTTNANNNLEIQIPETSVALASLTSVKDQGYSYSDYLQTTATIGGTKTFTSKYRFGGMFYLEETYLAIFKIKYSNSVTVSDLNNSVECKQITTNTQQYIIYYTTIGSEDNTSYQITHCAIKNLQSQAPVVATGKILVTFTFLSYTDILEEQGYGNRLQVFVKKLFYPLEQFLSGSILTISISIILIIFSIILV